mgnify:CR=1 FL=1
MKLFSKLNVKQLDFIATKLPYIVAGIAAIGTCLTWKKLFELENESPFQED